MSEYRCIYVVYERIKVLFVSVETIDFSIENFPFYDFLYKKPF